MYEVTKTFVCRGCVNPVTGTGRTSVDIGVNANLELVDKFCYLGDMLSVDGAHTHNRFTAVLEFVRDHPGEQVPER